MTNDWHTRSDEELAKEANTGMGGQGAVVEMVRRLRVAIVEQQRSANRLTWVILFLTVVLAFEVVYRLLKQILNHCDQLCSY